MTEEELVELDRDIIEACNEALREVRKRHAMNGIPMASWRDGRVVWLDPVTLDEVPAPPFARTNRVQK